MISHKLQFFVLALFLSLTLTVQAQDAIKWHKFEDGLSKAQAEDKYLLVDFYTDWCGWCKKMDANTYTDKSVIDLINKNFVAVKLNPEKDAGVNYQNEKYPAANFAQAAGVTGYPATGFFESDSDFIATIPGYMEPEKMIELLNFIVNKDYLKEKE